jgi:transcriptional regulator with XRE-family HTH domain
MEKSLHDFVVERLEAAKGKWPVIAEATGVSNRTIQKIASREIQDPGVSHIEKLAQYFRAQPGA